MGTLLPLKSYSRIDNFSPKLSESLVGSRSPASHPQLHLLKPTASNCQEHPNEVVRRDIEGEGCNRKDETKGIVEVLETHL